VQYYEYPVAGGKNFYFTGALLFGVTLKCFLTICKTHRILDIEVIKMPSDKKKINLTVPDEVYDRLQVYKEKNGITNNASACLQLIMQQMCRNGWDMPTSR